MHIPQEKDVLDHLVAWGTAHSLIRTMILTSTRTRPDGSVDLLSDYDLILAVSDVRPFAFDTAWISDYDQPMVRWSDQGTSYDLATYFRGVIYQNYVKIDYSIWPVEVLDRIATEPHLPAELDAGYRVLLDKDQRTAGWKLPSYQGYIPAQPTGEEYEALVEEFWWGTTYVAKSLWRDDLAFTKWILDQDLKIVTLRRMLEWSIEIDHDWSVKPGVLGRGLKHLLPAEIWSAFASTYVSLDSEETWKALDRLIALFRRVALAVGSALGYPYPQQVDDQVSAYLQAIRAMPSREHNHNHI
ncbi:MAG: aminoglycoside 6-adenylyltransferase [Ktedonobacteraceae bacterium]|nr:aminoglycoside 6-adenylyltransferase [Ktedonobacteraceae bacterium]